MRSKQKFITVTSLWIILIFTACTSQETSNSPVISENAVIYEFDSNNILEYKGVIIDNDFIIYKFGKNSELVKAVQKYDNMKTWMKTKEDQRLSIDDWELTENEQEMQWVIHCNPQEYDLESGPILSNCTLKDGHTLDFNIVDMMIITIRYTEKPWLSIDDVRNWEYVQSYSNEGWSEVREKDLGDVPK